MHCLEQALSSVVMVRASDVMSQHVRMHESIRTALCAVPVCRPAGGWRATCFSGQSGPGPTTG